MTPLRTLAFLGALSLALLSSHRAAGAQERSDSIMIKRVTPRWEIGSISVQMGAARLGLSELNDRLTAHDRPAFSTNVRTVGVSGSARFGRVLLGGGGETVLPKQALSPGWISKVSFRSALVDAGVVLLDVPRVLVYPQVSLGMRTMSLRMERSGDFAYDSGVQDPARGVTLSSRSLVAGFGLAAETRWNTSRTGAFSIGVRAGYVQPLGRPSTTAGASDVTGTPREHAGRYLRLSFGKPMGSRRSVMSALSTALLSIIPG